MFNQTALGAVLSSSTLLRLRSSFLLPAEVGFGLAGSLMSTLLARGGVSNPELVGWRLAALRSVFLPLLETGVAVAADCSLDMDMERWGASAPTDFERTGARFGPTRFMRLRRARSWEEGTGRENREALRPRRTRSIQAGWGSTRQK